MEYGDQPSRVNGTVRSLSWFGANLCMQYIHPVGLAMGCYIHIHDRQNGTHFIYLGFCNIYDEKKPRSENLSVFYWILYLWDFEIDWTKKFMNYQVWLTKGIPYWKLIYQNITRTLFKIYCQYLFPLHHFIIIVILLLKCPILVNISVSNIQKGCF